ncbi:putative polypeptide n-acetylgalactosaminyltransferase 12 [Cardiosporidium cionae]|uniref:Polypeptide n-acetylgalactosaminyltransferase 12 n=1 Tax=Cardiosporidium cionae TaxID=476202 RepID=A0ABQ7J8L9_9APIC|nr:putative polypeptide n-acetylgalactosaminyltransferase 12 [Cardiosporidium cionae]|eukprot:KAF8820321.1 putative polypeptide n-acetylgalactosaminyltransferase 12 [Cardiosporidium cionae]
MEAPLMYDNSAVELSSIDKNVFKSVKDSTCAVPDNREFTPTFSIIISARDEEKYIAKTILYILLNTPAHLIEEILIVDDASSLPLLDVLNKLLPQNSRGFVKVVRLPEHSGLIRARLVGTKIAKGSYFVFMDAHCKPKSGWIQALQHHLQQNYKRVVSPVILVLNSSTWEDTSARGYQVMFDWKFELHWTEKVSNFIPVLAGGIFAVTKKWWFESGALDPMMLGWGGENIEFSLRTWLCGGEIILERRAEIGHIFYSRAERYKNEETALMIQAQRNRKRAAMVWLDDYFNRFEKLQVLSTNLDEGPGVTDRVIQRMLMRCLPFTWYINKFKDFFEDEDMIAEDIHHLRHSLSLWCLAGIDIQVDAAASVTSADELEKNRLVLLPCNYTDLSQKWNCIRNGTMLKNVKLKKCLDACTLNQRVTRESIPLLSTCKYTFNSTNLQQKQHWNLNLENRKISHTYLSEDNSISRCNNNSNGCKEEHVKCCLQADLRSKHRLSANEIVAGTKSEVVKSYPLVYFEKCNNNDHIDFSAQSFELLW